MILRTPLAIAFLLAAAVQAVAAPVEEAKLVKPPANAEKWVIVSSAGQHGQSLRWTEKDGTHWSRESLNLRGFKSEIDQQQHLTPDGYVSQLEVRGSTPSGDAAETFTIANGRYKFASPVDKGAGRARHDLLYAPFGGTLDATIALLDTVMHAPNRTAEMLPSGRVSLEELTTFEVKKGATSRKLTAYVINGFGFSPAPVWYDGDHFFGQVGVISFLPDGWADVAQVLSKAQDEALAKRAPAMLAKLAPKATTPVAFKNVRLYDADAKAFKAGVTVVVRDGLIAAVGPAASTEVPKDAQVFDGKGKTLVPGLWDNHMHYGDDSTGPLLLSQGITNARDPGNQPAELEARKKRIETGELLGTRIVPSLLIDGPGERQAQAGTIVKTLDEALAAVRHAKEAGYFGIKLYGSLNPAFVKPMADEAHKLGLRVHGHIPADMRPLDAVRAGYDEITHINFVMMQAMPDSVVKDSNGLQRFFGPGKYAAGVNLKSPEMTAYLDELAKRGTAVDPTLAVFEGVLTDERGKMGKSIAAFEGTLPPAVERGSRSGAISPPADLDRATMRKSFAKLQALVVELQRRGITILAGTDGTGIELVRDLELYVAGGMKPEDALATATINPAKAFKLDKETGSIAVGKKAELALVAGDPSKRIGDLRKVEIVMRDGRLMKAQDLRAAVGISGPPKK